MSRPITVSAAQTASAQLLWRNRLAKAQVVLLLALLWLLPLPVAVAQVAPFNEKLCPADHPEPGLLSDNSLMCFAQCKLDYLGVGPICVAGDCFKNGTCLSMPTCKEGQSSVLGVCMTNCSSGYRAVGNACTQLTPPGWQDGVVFFFRFVPKRVCVSFFCKDIPEYQTQSKHIYTRSVGGLANHCSSGYAYKMGMCVRSDQGVYGRSQVSMNSVPATSTASFVRSVTPFVAGERFAVAVLSDTQLPWDETSPEAKAGNLSTEALWRNSRAHNLSLVQAVNALQASRQHSTSPLAFTVMNGDLTAFFHPHEVSEFRAFYDPGFSWSYPNVLQTPLYLGLGNHDYQNNLGNCQSFTLDTNRCAKNAINLIRGAVFKNYISNMPAATLESYDASSLAYSWNRGRYHFVQLHNGPSYSIPTLGIGTPIEWLKADLQRASARGQIIIINMHDPQMRDPEFTKALDGYPVAAVFAGHWHESHGKKFELKTYSGQKIPVFLSGSADYRTFLLVDFEPSHLTITPMSSHGGQAQAKGRPVVIRFDGWSHAGGVKPEGVDLSGPGRVVEVDLEHPNTVIRFGGMSLTNVSRADVFTGVDRSSPGVLTFWAVQNAAPYSKALKIQLTDNAKGGMTLKPLEARYTWGDMTVNPNFDWNSQGQLGWVSDGLTTIGYGINSVELQRR